MSIKIHLHVNIFDRTNHYKDMNHKHMVHDGLLITTTIPRYRSRKTKFARSKTLHILCISYVYRQRTAFKWHLISNPSKYNQKRSSCANRNCAWVGDWVVSTSNPTQSNYQLWSSVTQQVDRQKILSLRLSTCNVTLRQMTTSLKKEIQLSVLITGTWTLIHICKRFLTGLGFIEDWFYIMESP